MKTLQELIKSVGDDEFAASIGKSKFTARSYRQGKRTPPGPVAMKILVVYKGKINYSGIYGKPE